MEIGAVGNWATREIMNGDSTMDIGGWAVKILIGMLLASILLPIAISNLIGADQTGWDASTVALWAIIPIAIVIGLVIAVFRSSGLKTGKG